MWTTKIGQSYDLPPELTNLVYIHVSRSRSTVRRKLLENIRRHGAHVLPECFLTHMPQKRIYQKVDFTVLSDWLNTSPCALGRSRFRCIVVHKYTGITESFHFTARSNILKKLRPLSQIWHKNANQITKPNFISNPSLYFQSLSKRLNNPSTTPQQPQSPKNADFNLIFGASALSVLRSHHPTSGDFVWVKTKRFPLSLWLSSILFA